LIALALLLIQCRTQSVVVNKTEKTSPEEVTQDVLKVDTVQWEVEEEKVKTSLPNDGIVYKDVEQQNTELNKQFLGNVAFLLPLSLNRMNFTGERVNRRDELMLHYTMGVRLGLDQLKAQNDIDLNVHIEDTQSAILPDRLKSLKEADVSLIIGGRGKSEVETIADFARENELIYCSTWQTNSSFVGKNPYYVQMNPGLHAHLLTILQDVLPKYGREQIVLFGSENERSRINELNRMYKMLSGDSEDLESIVVDSVQELDEYEMLEYQERDSQTVFIVPLTRTYNMIHDFFRVLEMNELQDKSIVYGVTDWKEEKLIPLINNYDVRLTTFFDHVIDQRYVLFEEQFYSRMGSLPEDIAYEGYNHALLAGEMIKGLNSGTSLSDLDIEAPGVRMQLTDHNNLMDPQLDKAVIQDSYWENKFLYIVGYKDFKYYRLN
jgi:hypothetical protein